MNNNFIDQPQDDDLMLYYLLPSSVKRRCRALKNISLEQESLEVRHRRLRRNLCKKYSSENSQEQQKEEESRLVLTCPFGYDSLRVVTEKADDLKSIATSHRALEAARLSASSSKCNPDAIREILDSCESKCHEILTHLANVDWELYEFEQSLSLYHADMEEAMTKYNMELSALYKRRSGIIQGDYEPTDDECNLPDSLNLSTPPKYLSNLERVYERLLASRRNHMTHDYFASNRILGVPKFWTQTVLIALRQLDVIEEADHAPLNYLVDVRYYYDTERDSQEPDSMNSHHRTQVLLFYFDKNPHFSNRILSKTIYIDKSCQSGCRMFDGLWVTKKEGCTINWYPGRDLTVGELNQRPEPDAEDEQVEHEPTRVTCRSFFNFFTSPGLNYDGRCVRRRRRSCDRNEFVEVELDYEVFVRFRDFIVPHAIIAYSRGHLFGFGPSSESPEKLAYLKSLFDLPTSTSSDYFSAPDHQYD